MTTTQAQIAVLLQDLEADRRRIKVLDRHIPAVESSEDCARSPLLRKDPPLLRFEWRRLLL